MNDSAATACIRRREWLATAALAVASLVPVGGVAAEWDIAIEGGYAPARESLSTQRSRLDVSVAGVFVAGIYDEMTRTPAVVLYPPNSIEPAWVSMMGHAGDAGTLSGMTPQRVNAADDRSSLVIGAQLTRLDPDGHVQWAAYPEILGKVEASAILPDGDVLLAVGNPFSLRRHDGATGRLIGSSYQPRCSARSIVVVDASTAYVARTCVNPQMTETVQQVLQIDPATLAVRWTYVSAQVPTIVADETGLYLADGNLSILKLSATNGAFLWNFFRSSGLRMLGTAANGDILSAYDVGSVGSPVKRIERIDHLSGVSLWTRDVPGTFNARVNRDAVVMTGSTTSAEGVVVPYVEVLDIDSGAIAWRTPFAAPSGTQVRMVDAVANGSHVVALGKQCPAPSGEVRCELAVWHLDRLSGVVAAMQPLMVQSSLVSDTTTSAAGRIWTAAIDWVATGQRLRLFAHAASDGAVLAETEIPAPMSAPVTLLPADSVTTLVGADGSIAVLLKRQNNVLGNVHDAVVLKFDATGAFRWRKSLLAGLPGQSGVTAELASVDAAGNVLLGMQEFFGQPDSWTGYMPNRRWMARLAAASGTVDWQREFRPVSSGSLFLPSPPQASPIGDDLWIGEAPADETWIGTARMSGTNGNVGWVNGDASMLWTGLHRPGPSSLLAVETISPATRVRIDPDSGATQWTAQYSYPGDRFFFQWKVADSPVDERYLLSTTRRTTDASGERNGALLLSVDRQTGALQWTNRFDANPSNRFERMDAIAVVDDRLYASGPSRSGANYVVGLMALDAATGSEGEARALWSSSWRVAGDVAQGVGNPVKFMDGDALLQWPLRAREGKALHLTLARRELGRQTAFGDIRVTLDWAPTTIAGTPGAHITFTAANAGPDSAEGVRSIIDVPLDSPLLDVSCTIDAMPCDVDIGAAWIKGMHTIPAGARLVISARFANTATFGMRSLFSASAVGPFRLVEPTLNDNFAESDLGTGDLILRTGFD